MTWENEPGSALTHLVGALLAIAALVLLVVFSSLHGTPSQVVGFSLFGTFLVLLYVASTLYHFLPQGKAKRVFKRIDHVLIYALIAGTYTPICLVILPPGWGWTLFGIVWGLALVGILIKAFGIMLHPVANVLFYLVIGWIALIAVVPLTTYLPVPALWLLLLGGLFYSFGTIFFGLEAKYPRQKRWWGHHETFHLFVLAGSAMHVWMMLQYVL